MSFTLGTASLFFAIFASVYGIIALIIGEIKRDTIWTLSGRQACRLVFPLLSISTGTLLFLLLKKNYQYSYVFQTVNNETPIYLRIAALWGRQSGSLLFWSWLFSLNLFIWTFHQKWDNHSIPNTATVFLLTNLFVTILINMKFDNPFQRLWQTDLQGNITSALYRPANTIPALSSNGTGMNPLLRHFGMIFHPPVLYLGFIAAFFPTAQAISSLIHQTSKSSWFKQTHSWMVLSWIFMGIGLSLGSRWAYDVLGWGGYWGWDPVEVSALIPFLLMSVSLHSVALNKRLGGFERWITFSILFSCLMVIFSVFVTRSGLVESVHAFSESSVSQPLLLWLIIMVIIILLLSIRVLHYPSEKVNRSISVFHNFQTLEFSMTAENIILYLIAFFCLWGILLPSISNLFSSIQIAINSSYYINSTGPLFLLMIFILSFTPSLHWHSSLMLHDWIRLGIVFAVSALISLFLGHIFEKYNISVFFIFALLFFGILNTIVSLFIQNSNRKIFSINSVKTALLKQNFHSFGGILIHLGIFLIALGIVGMEFLQIKSQISLSPGENFSFSKFSVKYDHADQSKTDELQSFTAFLIISDKSGNIVTIQPRRDYFYKYDQEITHPGTCGTLAGEFYSVLESSESKDSQSAKNFTFYYNPLVIWLWIGCILMSLGGIVQLIKSS